MKVVFIMLLWTMVIGGALIFTLGIYFLLKNYKAGKYVKRYGNIAYGGLGILVLGIILLMEPIFTKLPQNISGVVPAFIAIVIFIIAGQFLLKPIGRKK